MTLGERIQLMRKKAGLSQEGLAEVVGVSRQAVSKWETGEATPEVGKLLLLSRTFGVTADWLISDDGPDAPSEPERNREEPKVEDRTGEAHGGEYDRADLLKRLAKRYGWPAGARIAIVGAVFAVLGIVISLICGIFFDAGAVAAESVPVLEYPVREYAEVTYVTEEGDALVSDISPAAPTVERTFGTLSGVFITLGVVLLSGGGVMALALRRYGEKE